MGDSYLDNLLANSSVRSLNEGDAVFHFGKPAEAVFYVLSGEVHLYRHDQDGRRLLLFRAYDGDFFAEASLNANHYHCTAICIRPTKLRVINAHKLRDLLRKDPEFAAAWISRLSTELRRQRANVERLNLKSTAARVQHLLLTEGSPPGELQLKGSISEVADVLGVSRESLYRTLSKMHKQGALERSKNKLRLIS